MSESKTPRTDAVKYESWSVQPFRPLCIELELENAELKRQLAEANEARDALENEAIQSRATIKLLTESTAELSAIKKQIQDGEPEEAKGENNGQN